MLNCESGQCGLPQRVGDVAENREGRAQLMAVGISVAVGREISTIAIVVRHVKELSLLQHEEQLMSLCFIALRSVPALPAGVIHRAPYPALTRPRKALEPVGMAALFDGPRQTSRL